MSKGITEPDILQSLGVAIVVARQKADAMERAGAEQARRADENLSALNEARQRELELLAVIERMEPIAYLNELDEPYTMYGWSSACINPDHKALYLKPVIDTKALREHEAKIVAEYKQRAEAAEAKLRELIPIARIDALSSTKPTVGLISALNDYSPTIGDLLYSKPFPAPKQEEK